MNKNLQGWDDYAKNVNSIWPSEHLIRFLSNCKPDQNLNNILEIGCGSGRNSLYIAKQNYNLTITDISKFAIDKTLNLLETNGLSAKYFNGDIIDFRPESYDIIIDISSLQHLSLDDLKNTINKLYKKMPRGGKIFSITKRREDSIYMLGEKISESEIHYQQGIPKVYYEANITFLTLDQIYDMYSFFSKIEINFEEWTYNSMNDVSSHWLVTAEK